MLTSVLVVVGTVLLGLMAGLYVAFSVAIIPAWRRVDDAGYVVVVRSVNAAIQNPAFGVCFAGALLVPTSAAGLLVTAAASPAAGWALAGTGAYALGLVVTLVVNVPLNQRLDRTDEPAARARTAFEQRWNRAHRVRTAATVLGFVLFLLAVRTA